MMLQSVCVSASEEPQTCKSSSDPAAMLGTCTGEQGQQHPQSQLLALGPWNSLDRTLCLQLHALAIPGEMHRIRYCIKGFSRLHL